MRRRAWPGPRGSSTRVERLGSSLDEAAARLPAELAAAAADVSAASDAIAGAPLAAAARPDRGTPAAGGRPDVTLGRRRRRLRPSPSRAAERLLEEARRRAEARPLDPLAALAQATARRTRRPTPSSRGCARRRPSASDAPSSPASAIALGAGPRRARDRLHHDETARRRTRRPGPAPRRPTRASTEAPRSRARRPRGRDTGRPGGDAPGRRGLRPAPPASSARWDGGGGPVAGPVLDPQCGRATATSSGPSWAAIIGGVLSGGGRGSGWGGSPWGGPMGGGSQERRLRAASRSGGGGGGGSGCPAAVRRRWRRWRWRRRRRRVRGGRW